MSKLLWKSLIISPAVLGTMLVAFAGAVRATDGINLLAAESKAPKEASQLQTGEAHASEVPSLAKDTTSSPLTVEPTGAQGKEPHKEAIAPSQKTPATPEAEIPASRWVAQATKATVAQLTPAAPTNTQNVVDLGNSDNTNALDQVTNVTQLTDVRPTD
ncbi:MAG TPA: hypothetical protein V6D14_13265, partial [Coleofasciculaceae cyanobacterium]